MNASTPRGFPFPSLLLSLSLVLILARFGLPAPVWAGDTVPIGLELTTPADALQPGAVVDVTGWFDFEDDGYVTVRFEALGGAALQGPSTLELGFRTAGEVIPFSIPVAAGNSGRAGVHVFVEVADATGEILYGKRRGLYSLSTPEGTLTGIGGFLALEQLGAARAPADASTQSENETVAGLYTLDGTWSSTIPEFSLPTPQERELNVLLGAPADGYLTPGAPQRAPEGGAITIQGNISWTDENGVVHPAWGASVQIWDDDLIVDEFVDVVATDVNGNYSITVDNDDGIGAGDRDIYVVLLTANTWIDCQTSGGNTYGDVSATWDEVPSGSILNYSFIAGNTGTGPAMSQFQAGTWIAGYIAFDLEGAGLPSVDIVWPNGGTGSFFDGQVKMSQGDRWDWDVTHHEFGHYVQGQFGIANNPGGAHSSSNCNVDARDGDKSEGLRLAWGESWPTYFALSGQAEMGMAGLNVPRVGDVSYQDFEDATLQYSLETSDNNGRGEDNERAIMRLFWDLYDTADDQRDAYSMGDNALWAEVKAAAGNPQVLSTYWTGIRSGKSNQVDILLGEISADQQQGPRLNSPAEGAIVSPSNNSFSWQAMVGCPTSYVGDTFDLVFYDANTFAKVLTKPGLASTTHNLSLADLQTLIAASHDILWGVEGYHLAVNPASGPYLGETFAITVNRPPTADAGPDQTVECTSPTTTAVQLDGTGSSDPDGDPLTYSWSAAGVVFDDATSATPTGAFPFGTTVVTLTVFDGIEEDSDTVSITVEDTTPPVITCPADITVECSVHGGTPKDDPQLAPFFAGVSATDVCDDDPTITDDAPDLFPLGETTVTFTATDDHDNFSECTAVVTVEDTTPPEITVELDRDVLWPPNHKMVKITATVEVTDICDPNPTFALTSIESDEPDNGLGDGDTEGDIEAVYEEGVVCFNLRSERQGTGDGRKYTIIYTGMDMSGNTAPDTVCVIVPHDQSGQAQGASGLIADGTAFESGARTLRLVIYPADGVEAGDIDWRNIYLGNFLQVIRPSEVWSVDVNDDGKREVVAAYPLMAAEAIRTAGEGLYTLGLHYRTGLDDTYLVPDIFVLGETVDLGSGFVQTDGGGIVPNQPEPGSEEAEAVFETAAGAPVSVEVYNVLGQRIRRMPEMTLSGSEFRWDGRDDAGRRAPGGIYFYRIRSQDAVEVRKIYLAH